MDFFTPFVIAVQMLAGFDASLYEIIGLSLQVSLVAVGAALMLGLPLGAVLASFQFTGRTAVVVVTNTLLSLPPVVVGLVVYLFDFADRPAGISGSALFSCCDDDGAIYFGAALVCCLVTSGL